METRISRDMAAVWEDMVLSVSLADQHVQDDETKAQPPSSLMDGIHHALAMKPLTDDHPEPTLEPMSDHKEFAGHMIPSTSNISLLLLNHQTDEKLTKLQQMPSMSMGVLLGTHAPWTSMVSLGSRMGHPTTSLLHRDGSMLENESPFVPMRSSQLSPPSSPSLDATLVAGSPLRLWLLSHAPPIRTNPIRRLLNLSQRPQLALSLSAVSVLTLSRRGMPSPTLDPVQTPLEELPMTPLNLSSSPSIRPQLLGGFASSPEFEALGEIE